MGGVWSFITTINHVGTQRIITYDVDFAQENAGFNVNDVCTTLLHACIEPHGKKYEPTPEQQKRMDEAMIKINKVLSRVFKE